MSATGTEFNLNALNANYLRSYKYKRPPFPSLPTNINALIYLVSFESLHNVFDGVQEKSSSIFWLLLLLMLLSYTPPCRHGARRLRLLLLPWQSEMDLQSRSNLIPSWKMQLIRTLRWNSYFFHFIGQDSSVPSNKSPKIHFPYYIYTQWSRTLKWGFLKKQNYITNDI